MARTKKPSIKATLYQRPNAKKSVITVSEITAEDAEFFKANNIKISLEPQGNDTDNIIMYADYGKRTEDGEPEEIIIFSRGRECSPCMTELRQLVEPALELLKQEQADNE